MRLRLAFIFCLLIILPDSIKAQKSCGTVAYQEILQKEFPQLEQSQQFEDWIKLKISDSRQTPGKLPQKALLNEVITIPVVVHIIHNGEAEGIGSNLDESRIFEQIQILNEDFRRMNADAVNTPAPFLGVAADVEIEFALAVRDPEGLPTTGINRLQGSRSSWGVVHNTELKSQIYWPADDYLNIWVAPLESLLGYAQFPVSGLGGLDIASENSFTDGVVIDTDFMGNNPNSNPESKGRTATHEIGHYLGLRHIWGDGGCGVDDFCADTPLANSSNFGCPDNNSCGSDDMVQNYMDLTDDTCMNLFTLCQKDRMRVVMDNSPRRLSLLSSPGLTPPVMVTNDAGVKEISMPQANNCLSENIPQAIIRNYGTNAITSGEVALLIDNVVVETQPLNTTLQQLETTTISFSNQSIPDQSTVLIRITLVNGSIDNNPENDQKQVTVTSATLSALPLTESFEVFPAGWDLRNDDNSFTWEIANAVLEAPNNTAIKMDFFSYDNGDGEYDYLVTPGLDFTTFTEASLEFKLSYAQFSSGSRDGLIVAVSTNCGNSYDPANYQFEESGSTLSTVPITSNDFVPASQNDWRTVTLDLTAFAGMDQIKVAFIGINDFGNNLYLDDINITGTQRPDLDLAISAIRSPSLVSCQTVLLPEITLQNTGIDVITTFQVAYTMSSGENGTTTLNSLMLDPDERITAAFFPITLSSGAGVLTASIVSVNGIFVDGNLNNNTLSTPYIIDQQNDIIPKIETFQSSLPLTDWVQLSLDEDISWEVGPAGGLEGPGNNGAVLNFFNYSQPGAMDYLVSPVLDFSNASNPTMTFDVAYAGGDNFNDGLRVLVSTNCGETYSETVFSAFGLELATVQQSTEFFPSGTSDWQKIEVDLSAYAGQNNIRVAFVGVNDFGNNLYLDNIEFFTTDNTFSLELEDNELILFPNPAEDQFNITFNLAERGPIIVLIFDPLGRLVKRFQLNNVLNQTFEVSLPNSAGVYILQATATSFKETRRIIMTR